MGERDVVVLGVGLHKFGRFEEKSVGQIAAEAGLMALKDAGMSPGDVQCGFASHVELPVSTGTQVFNTMGIYSIPISNVELACASCTRAVILGAQAILSGECDTCLVVGVEKQGRGMIQMTGLDRASICQEGLLGIISAPTMYALLGNRHSYLHGTKPEHLAQVSVIAHRNACLNPFAQYQEEMSLETVMSSRMLVPPITLYQCSGASQGASAVLLCSKKKARQYTANPVYMTDWQAGSPAHVKGNWWLDLHDSDLEEEAKKLYEKAGIGPEDIDVAQVHDAFTPAFISDIEELGFCEPGEGGPFVWEGNTEITGKIPVNTDGGLIGRGHPMGATGGAMIAELTYQLRGTAGPRQVKGAKTGLLHNAGGGGGQVILLRR